MALSKHATVAAHALLTAYLAAKAGDGRPDDDPWVSEKRDRIDEVYDSFKRTGTPVELRDLVSWMDPANFRRFEQIVLDLPGERIGTELAVACQSYCEVYRRV